MTAPVKNRIDVHHHLIPPAFTTATDRYGLKKAVGMVRSDAGAATLRTTGAEVHRGDLADVQSRKSSTSRADGVIHCAFNNE